MILETATIRTDLLCFAGHGEMRHDSTSAVAINEDFVPTGRNYVLLAEASSFQPGDSVLIYRPGTEKWVHDLKMDQIVERNGTRQWKPSEYDLYFERIITSISANRVTFDNLVLLQMTKEYGGGFVMKYHYLGRIRNCGVENLRMESTFTNDTDENHGWTAINFSNVEQAWARNVVAQYFGYSCVFIDKDSRNISVLDSKCLDGKSQVTGGRRYSFNCNGQLNLFKNCYTTEVRHDYVTGAKTLGPMYILNASSAIRMPILGLTIVGPAELCMI